MNKIKSNKEVVILLVIILYIYVLLFLGGCNEKLVGNRVFSSGDMEVSLISENYKSEPFFSLGVEGMDRLKKQEGIDSKIILLEVTDSEEKINDVMNRVAMKSNLVIVLGGFLKTPLQISSRELREKNFAVIDEVIDEGNVKSVVYKNQEGSYLMGIVAGGETKTNKVGFVGGLNNNTGESFLSGYAAGVKNINKKAYESLINYENVRYIEDFKNKEKAYVKARELYGNGCDIVFHACGSAGEGVFKAAKEMKRKAIGVDVDCAVEYKEYSDVIISSMVKRIDKTVENIGKEVKEGTFKSGIENKEEVGIKEEVIDYASSTKGRVSNKTFERLVIEKKRIGNLELEVPKKIFEAIEFNGE